MCPRSLRRILSRQRYDERSTMSVTATRLSDVMAGRAVFPGDSDWDTARQAFDLLVDLRPEAVAFPNDERDVVAVVNYARAAGLRIAPQATGHNAGPLGSLEGAILLS